MTSRASDPIAAAAEAAAYSVIAEFGLPNEDSEPALETLGRVLGAEFDYKQGLRAFAEALLAPYPAMSEICDLVEAKIELLSEYKLEYPRNYSPGDIARMNGEVNRLRSLQDRLVEHQT